MGLAETTWVEVRVEKHTDPLSNHKKTENDLIGIS